MATVRRIFVLAVLAALPVALSAPGAVAQNTLNCDDFDTQAEAQAQLDADPSDPHNLDTDDDGVACESLPGGTRAGEYPPGGVEVTLSCSATVVVQGGDVTCTVVAQAFQAGTSVTASATSGGAQSVGAGPAVANVGTALLAQSSTEPFSLTEQVTAAGDGSAAATFQIPADAETGPVTVTFSGTAPDGTDQVITEQQAFRVVAAEAAGDGQAGGLATTGANSGLWIGIAAALVLIGGGSVWLARRRQGSGTGGG